MSEEMWVTYGKTESGDDVQPLVWNRAPSDIEVDVIYREQLPEEYAEAEGVAYRTVKARTPDDAFALVKRELFTQTLMRTVELEEEIERLKAAGLAVMEGNRAYHIEGQAQADRIAKLEAALADGVAECTAAIAYEADGKDDPDAIPNGLRTTAHIKLSMIRTKLREALGRGE